MVWNVWWKEIWCPCVSVKETRKWFFRMFEEYEWNVWVSGFRYNREDLFSF